MSHTNTVVLPTGDQRPRDHPPSHGRLGVVEYDLCGPPSRLWADQEQPPVQIFTNVDSARVRHLPSPAQALRHPPDGETWTARSRASLARLWAYYLLAEDPQRRLDAREVSTLAHQVSLVRHILDADRTSAAS